MKLSVLALLIALLVGATNSISYAQKTNYIGLNSTLETTSSSFKPGIGFLFERKMTKRSGIETGLYYRNYMQTGLVTISDASGYQSFSLDISESHLSIPALYKFYTNIVNLSAGPSFDFYLGWRQKHKNAVINLDSYSIDPAFSIGLMGKISKSITLNKQFALEPELRLNHILTFNRTFIGLGIAGKYKL